MRDFLPYAVLESTHALRAGGQGKRFMDFDRIASDPAKLECIVAFFKGKLQEIQQQSTLGFLAFIDKGPSGYSGATVGAIVLASALSLETYLPFVLVRSDRKALSEKVKMAALYPNERDASLGGLTGALVTDHMGEGCEMLDAIAALEQLQGGISHCLAYTCDESSMRRADFESMGIHIDYFERFEPRVQQT